MKQEYVDLEMDIITFEQEDIIITSNPDTTSPNNQNQNEWINNP